MFTAIKFLAWITIAFFAIDILPIVNSFPAPIEYIFDSMIPMIQSMYKYIPVSITVLFCLGLWLGYQISYFCAKLIINFFREGT